MDRLVFGGHFAKVWSLIIHTDVIFYKFFIQGILIWYFSNLTFFLSERIIHGFENKNGATPFGFQNREDFKDFFVSSQILFPWLSCKAQYLQKKSSQATISDDFTRWLQFCLSEKVLDTENAQDFYEECFSLRKRLLPSIATVREVERNHYTDFSTVVLDFDRRVLVPKIEKCPRKKFLFFI